MTFQENFTKTKDEYGLGSLLIAGLCPSHSGYNPIGKIWASVRKRIWERYCVDVVGLFTYNSEKEVVMGTFCLNYSVIEESGIDRRIYVTRFTDTFQLQMTLFEEALIAFADSPNGLTDYEAALVRGANNRQLDQLLNSFLRSINIRTEEDERRSQRH